MPTYTYIGTLTVQITIEANDDERAFERAQQLHELLDYHVPRDFEGVARLIVTDADDLTLEGVEDEEGEDELWVPLGDPEDEIAERMLDSDPYDIEREVP